MPNGLKIDMEAEIALTHKHAVEGHTFMCPNCKAEMMLINEGDRRKCECGLSWELFSVMFSLGCRAKVAE